MKLTDYLTEDFIKINFEVNSKEEVIDSLIEIISISPFILDKEKIKHAVWKREKEMSTGVGNFFAIPHAKTDGVSNIIFSIAILSKEIDFQSFDSKPVQIVFLMLCKEELVGLHIKLLSRISRLMNQEEFRIKLLSAKSTSEVMSIFISAETKYFDV